ncbi:MAG: hypothetical protein LBT44_02060, partial [Clostridiales bacterium]|nr:hypothetical protein [Clostridiales bacterium]
MNSNQWRVSFWGILILVMLFGIHQNNQYITREAQEIFTEANFEVIDEVVWEMASQYQSADYS